ncbi:hypothetical protein [Corynebacterium ulcerans]|uniref:hypothetical protein n=1 Tax=Corynebacterium ulcerans TaxID=65058 RepID=UPI0034A53B44
MRVQVSPGALTKKPPMTSGVSLIQAAKSGHLTEFSKTAPSCGDLIQITVEKIGVRIQCHRR